MVQEGDTARGYRLVPPACGWDQLLQTYADLFPGGSKGPASPHMIVRGKILNGMAFSISDIIWHRISDKPLPPDSEIEQNDR